MSEKGWQPDWVVSPGEMLREWMEENKYDVFALAANCCSKNLEAELPAMIASLKGILSKEPITDDVAQALALGTRMPAAFWMALEHNYRAGLARGLRDTE